MIWNVFAPGYFCRTMSKDERHSNFVTRSRIVSVLTCLMHLTAFTLMHILDDSRTRKHLDWFSSRGVGLDTQYSRMDVLIVMFQAMLCFIDEKTVRRGARTISTRWHGWTLCRVSYTFQRSGEKGTWTLRIEESFYGRVYLTICYCASESKRVANQCQTG